MQNNNKVFYRGELCDEALNVGGFGWHYRIYRTIGSGLEYLWESDIVYTLSKNHAGRHVANRVELLQREADFCNQLDSVGRDCRTYRPADQANALNKTQQNNNNTFGYYKIIGNKNGCSVYQWHVFKADSAGHFLTQLNTGEHTTNSELEAQQHVMRMIDTHSK